MTPQARKSTGINKLTVSSCIQVNYVQMYLRNVLKGLITFLMRMPSTLRRVAAMAGVEIPAPWGVACLSISVHILADSWVCWVALAR